MRDVLSANRGSQVLFILYFGMSINLFNIDY
jgi:hypothetical protein